jgi:SAM-dependent methyltransferase
MDQIGQGRSPGRRPDLLKSVIDEAGGLRRDLGLFWVSCFMLFFEILLIRWLSAEIRIFSYFHNLVLLFAFLGIGLGAASARREVHLLASFALMTLLIALLGFDQYFGKYTLRNISSYLSAGAEFSIWAKAQVDSIWVKAPVDEPGSGPLATLPNRAIALIAGGGMLVFVVALITIFFIPFGQTLGRLFDRHERPLRAYGINLAGSLVGIWLFNAASLLSLPPAAWFALGGAGSLPLVRGRRARIAAGLLLAFSILILRDPPPADRTTVWSPYQKLTVLPAFTPIDGQDVQYGYQVLVNSAVYMQISNYSPEFVGRFPSAFPGADVPYDHYNIPYRFAERLDDVLIVGAGAGNDAAGALRNGAERVTAVDIDPKIIEIGRGLHPEAPYSDPRVAVVNDDARSFFKQTQGRYDVIVFGLLDSHTLSSSYSNVRLDNYVYTTESFQDAGRLLKPDGVMVLLFEVAGSDEFIGARIQHMVADAFGTQPIGFLVRSGFRGAGGSGFVAGNDDVIARHLAGDARLRAIVDETRLVQESWAGSDVSPATDDWPYLYLEGRSIPALYFMVFGVLLFFCLRGFRAAFGARQRVQWQFFFLGAGFMLLEVQNVSKLALLFGTTWTVNTVVISAVLVMIMLANCFAMRVRIASLAPYYVALLVSLSINFALPPGAFAGLPSGPKELAIGLIMGLPLFFAGVVFSTSFSAAEARSSALASNLLGALAGGMLESLSFLVGIKALLVVAALLYLFSLLSRRSPVALARVARRRLADAGGQTSY